MLNIKASIGTIALPLACALALGACGDDDTDNTGGAAGAAGGDVGTNAGKGAPVSEARAGASGAADQGADGEPLYALSVAVFDPDWNRTVYMHLSHSLDLGGEIDLGQARGFPGVANSAVVDKRFLVSSGDEATITEFEISDDFEWKPGNSVGFTDYPLDDNANFYYQFFVDSHTAYMPFDVTSRIVWDPTDLTISETLEDSKIELTKGALTAQIGGNRAGVKFSGPVRQTVFYTDKDYFDYSQETIVAIYDEMTHEEKSLVTLPCPAATTATVDEQGYTYYSTWQFQGTRALFGEGPKPCFARLKPDLTLDEEWTTDLRDITDGRYVNNLLYIGNGLAVGNVLYHELLDADWSGGYKSEVAEQISKDGDHWRIWLFDLDKRTGKPLEGVNTPVNGNSSFAVVDGHYYLFAVYDNWGRSKIFEFDADGQATEVLDTAGAVAKWERIR